MFEIKYIINKYINTKINQKMEDEKRKKIFM